MTTSLHRGQAIIWNIANPFQWHICAPQWDNEMSQRNYKRPVTPTLQCTGPTSHNTLFCKRKWHMCAHFHYKNGTLWAICLMHCEICKMGLIIFEEEGGNPPVRCYRRVRLLKAIKPGEKRTEWNSNKMHVSKTYICKMFARSCLSFRWHHLDIMTSNSWGLISLATLNYHYIIISGNKVKKCQFALTMV